MIDFAIFFGFMCYVALFAVINAYLITRLLHLFADRNTSTIKAVVTTFLVVWVSVILCSISGDILFFGGI